MWQHNYTPIHGSLLASSLVAALPIFVLLYLLGVRRTQAWIAALSGLGTTCLLYTSHPFFVRKTMAHYVAYMNDPANGFRSTTLPIGAGIEYSVFEG